LECGSLPPLYLRELARVPARWVESITRSTASKPVPRGAARRGGPLYPRELARVPARWVQSTSRGSASKLALWSAAACRRFPPRACSRAGSLGTIDMSRLGQQAGL